MTDDEAALLEDPVYKKLLDAGERILNLRCFWLGAHNSMTR